MGMSQQELAEILMTTQNQIYRYESGKNNPTGDVIIAIARALDVSADWLLGLSEEIKPLHSEDDLTDMERLLLNILRSKSPDEQLKLVEVAKVI